MTNFHRWELIMLNRAVIDTKHNLIMICVFTVLFFFPMIGETQQVDSELRNQFYISFSDDVSPLRNSKNSFDQQAIERQALLQSHLQTLTLPEDTEETGFQLTLLGALSEIRGGLVFKLNVPIPANELNAWLRALKHSINEVRFAEIDEPANLDQTLQTDLTSALVTPSIPNAEILEQHVRAAGQWYFLEYPGINAINAWPLTTGRGSKVTIVDQAFCVPDDNRLNNDNITHSPLRYCQSRYHSNHGTTILSQLATLHSFNSLNDRVGMIPDATFTTRSAQCVTEFIQGLDKAILDGSQVLTMSLGFGAPGDQCSMGVQEALDQAYEANLLVVNSSGNGSTTLPYYYWPIPKVCQHVETVANTEESGTLFSSSNFGPGINIASPGISLTGSRGTSNAAPWVAGMYAMMLTQDGGLPIDWQKRIAHNGRPVSECDDCKCPFNIIDAASSVIGVREYIEEGVAAGAYRTFFTLAYNSVDSTGYTHGKNIWAPEGSQVAISVDSLIHSEVSLFVRRQAVDVSSPFAAPEANLCNPQVRNCSFEVIGSGAVYEVYVKQEGASGSQADSSRVANLQEVIGYDIAIDLYPAHISLDVPDNSILATEDLESGQYWAPWRRDRIRPLKGAPSQSPTTVSFILPAQEGNAEVESQSFNGCLVLPDTEFWHSDGRHSKNKANWKGRSRTAIPGVINEKIHRCLLWGDGKLKSSEYQTLMKTRSAVRNRKMVAVGPTTSLSRYYELLSKSIGYDDGSGHKAYCVYQSDEGLKSGWADPGYAVCRSSEAASDRREAYNSVSQGSFLISLQ